MNIFETLGNIIGGLIALSIFIVVITLPISIPLLIIFLVMRKSNKTEQNQIISQQQIPITANSEPVNATPYSINEFLLTNKERRFYECLKPITDKYGYIVLSKMRIADIVSVTAVGNEYMQWFNKISRKHIDFIVCNKEFRPLLLIEVDDHTHDRPDRIERDKFVDEIFRNRQIKLIHLRQWDINELENVIINGITSARITV